MSQRYAQGYDENKNVANPDFFEEGMHTFAGEWNGGLDRDNFPQAALVASEVNTQGGTVRVFTEFDDVSFATDSAYTPDMATTGWQGGGGFGIVSSDRIYRATWTAPQDEHVDWYISLAWSWNGSYSHVASVAVRPDNTDTFDTVMYQLVVDGVVVATAGPFEDGAEYWAEFMCGSTQLAAGEHTAMVECLVVRRVAQTGALDGRCTNDLTVGSRSILAIRNIR